MGEEVVTKGKNEKGGLRRDKEKKNRVFVRLLY